MSDPGRTVVRPAGFQFNIFDFELIDDEMNRIRALDKNQRYFTMTLEEQEKNLSQFTPAD